MKKHLTFLLIDDDEDDRELFQLALDGLEDGINFFEADSCCKALEILEKKEVAPDYIFLDLNMPQMSGRECLIKLKESAQLLHIPVIIFSTSSDPRDMEETKNMGALGFITKPPKTSELTKILGEFIITYAETHLIKTK